MPFKCRNKPYNSLGFTLVELVLVVGLFGVLAGFATINLLKPQLEASVDSTVSTLFADLDHQRLKSMIGDSAGGSSAYAHGIYFETNQYTLFRGTSYSPTEPTNFVVTLSNGETITNVTFPSNQVVFNKISGEIAGFSTGSDGFTIEHSGVTTTVTLNRYGSMTIN